MQKNQGGFVLVTVLILTIVGTLVAFSAMSENKLQEQIGGNQRKELNARLHAERGIFETYKYIKTEK